MIIPDGDKEDEIDVTNGVTDNQTNDDTKTSSGKVANWFVMTGALTRKNYLMLWSGKFRLFLLLFLPILFFLLALLFDSIITSSWDYSYNGEDGDYGYDSATADQNPRIEKCTWNNVYHLPSNDCFTIMYTYDHENEFTTGGNDTTATSESEAMAMIDSIMETLAANNELTFQKMTYDNGDDYNEDDMIDTLAASYRQADIIGVPSSDTLTTFLARHDGHVDSSIVFTLSTGDYEEYEDDPFGYGYGMTYIDDYYNDISDVTLFTARVLNNSTSSSVDSITTEINKAALKVQVGDKPIHIKIDIQNEDWDRELRQRDDYYTDDDYELSFTLADGFLVIGYSFVCILFMNFIAREKQQELIGSLRLMGMHDTAYWASWIIVSLTISVFTSLGICITSYIFDFQQFSKIHFFIPFILLSVSQTIFMTTSFILIPLASTQRVLNIMQFIMIGVFIASYVGPAASFYAVAPSNTFVRVFQYLVPSTNFIMIIGPIFQYSSRYGDYNNLPNVYTWESFYTILNECDDIVDVNATLDDDAEQSVGCAWREYTDYYEETCWNVAYYEEYPDHCLFSASTHSSLFLRMILQFFIFLAITWYLMLVIPSTGNGIARRFWFFLDPYFWIGRRGKKNDENGYSTSHDDPNSSKSAQEESLVMTGLTKQFAGGNVAVKDIDLEIHQGEIFALLGHNGAGKTTLINMLTGKLSQTSGEAYLHGLKLSKDLRAIQQMTGIVPQHDRLWSELSAYDHIRLFATLKNQGSEENIIRILNKVYLYQDKYQASGEYSGGMKRRLSIAIASVGDAKILYMDEPTTGIDPLNRRRIWSLIQDLKVGRIIVLTTHLMQEADVLGDTVGIMDSGVMKVKGTPLSLKTEFGSGYTLNICTSQSSDVTRVCELAKQAIEGLEVVNSASTSTSLGIPKNQVSAIPSFAKQLQSEGLIQDWSVSQSTLEEVFLRLVAQESSTNGGTASHQNHSLNVNDDPEEMEEELVSETGVGEFVSSDGSEITIQPKVTSQVRALLRKQLILRRRSPVGTIMQFLLPIGFAVLLGLIQIFTDLSIYRQRAPMECGYCSNYDDYGNYVVDDNCDLVQNCYNRTMPSFWKEVFESATYPFDQINRDTLAELWEEDFTDYPYDYTTNSYCYLPSRLSTEVFITADGSKLLSGLPNTNNFTVKAVEEVRQIRKHIENRTSYFETFPYKEGFEYSSNGYWYGDEYAYYIGNIDTPTQISNCSEKEEAFEGIPRLGIDITTLPNMEDKAIQLDISFIFAQAPLRFLYCTIENGDCESNFVSWIDLKPAFDRWEIYYKDLEAASYNFLNGYLNVSQIGTMKAESEYEAMDVNYSPAISYTIMLYLPILLGASLSFSTISIVYDLVTEKQGGYVFALLLNGMRMESYWIASYLYHAILFSVGGVLFFVIILIFGVEIDLNWAALILVSLLFMHAQFSFTCLVSNFIKKPRLASALLMLFTFTLYFVMLSIVSADGSLISYMPIALDVIPQLSFIRSVYYIATRYDPGTVVVGNLIMILSSLVYLFLGIHLHRSNDMKDSISKLRSCRKKSSLPQHVDPTNKDNEEKDAINDTIDIDVRQEATRARELMPSETAVKVDGLSKTFQMKGFQFKNAVVDLTLAMDSGEVFGLLGPNGAGKTTAISMITGQLNASQGQVFVGGYNIETERVKALEKLGIVPQFDRLYDDLTVQEHLEMYAQIKGVVAHQLTEWSLYIAEKVSLHTPDFFTRKSKQLSGGMKRRLSIGIALLSHPKVLLLDEPTTGLDPAIKRSIWNIVESMRNERCILLTTHSMDEAEALCDRIGIMAKGSLLCIGTQNHLRSRYGDSFELSFTTAQASMEGGKALQSFLEDNFSDVTQVSSYGCSHVFTIARGGIDLTTLFNVVIQGQSEGRYVEWGVGQSSLDEIFITITAESEET